MTTLLKFSDTIDGRTLAIVNISAIGRYTLGICWAFEVQSSRAAALFCLHRQLPQGSCLCKQNRGRRWMQIRGRLGPGNFDIRRFGE